MYVMYDTPQVTNQLEGKPVDSSISSSSGIGGEEGDLMMMTDEDEEAMIDAKLAQLDERLKELNSKLGGRMSSKR